MATVALSRPVTGTAIRHEAPRLTETILLRQLAGSRGTWDEIRAAARLRGSARSISARRRPAPTTMRDVRAPTELCSRVLGVSPSAVRRPARPPHARPASPRSRVLDELLCRRVRELVRATHRRSCAITRPQCALPRLAPRQRRAFALTDTV
jgi:hypothetical protein